MIYTWKNGELFEGTDSSGFPFSEYRSGCLVQEVNVTPVSYYETQRLLTYRKTSVADTVTDDWVEPSYIDIGYIYPDGMSICWFLDLFNPRDLGITRGFWGL